MRKISKKAILILAIFAFSIIPVMPAYAAITIDPFEDEDGDPVTDGDKGDTVVVTGEGVVAGKDVNLYWDLVQDWDGEDGLLNSTDADEDGEYEIWFDVPEAVYGHHVIHVEDEHESTFASRDFDVYSKVSVSPDTGLAGDDDISVKGYGFHGGNDVVIIFNSSVVTCTTETETDVLEGEGDEDEFDDELENTPICPGTVVFYNGTGAQNITDLGANGTLYGLYVDDGKINYVTGDWEIEFDHDLSGNYEFDVEYNTTVETASMEVLASSDDTNDVGSFSKTVSIPDDFAIDRYDMYVYDGKGASALDRFDLGPNIELIPDEGPVGAVIKVKGRGFSDREYITSITLGGVECYNTSEVKTSSRGAFTISFVVPSVGDEDDYDVVVTDALAVDAEEEFEVDGLSEIELTPAYGGPNEVVQIEGWNFTQISDTDVDVNFTNGVNTYVDTYETDGDGHFSGSMRVPPEDDGDYDVYAYAEDQNINATKTFRMGFVHVWVRPVSGAEGTEVIIDGTGFTEDDDWNATLDGEDVIDDGEADGEDIYDKFYIPNIGTGTYDLTILDIDSEIEVHVEITVTEETYLELYPPSAANEYNIRISGLHFSDDEGADLEFELYNNTADGDVDFSWDISSDVYLYDDDEDDAYTDDEIELDDNGNFTGWWEVYDDEEISLGTYWLNVTDDNDLFAMIQMDIIDPEIEITSRKAAYEIDDTLAFNMESTFVQNNSYIEVYDPNDDLYWVTDVFDDDSWIEVGLLQVLPYYSQTSGQNPMEFTSDAPQGTWTWTWFPEDYDEDDDDVLDSGTFTLGPSSTSVLTEQMTDLSGDLTGLSDTVTDLAGTVGDLASDFGDVSDAVADTAAAVASVTSSVSDLADVVGDIADEASNAKTAADNAKSAADAAKDAADDAKTAASGLGTLVYGAIGASLVAAFAAIFSLMQINKKIA